MRDYIEEFAWKVVQGCVLMILLFWFIGGVCAEMLRDAHKFFNKRSNI